MSARHPIIAVTGSSGAGTSTVKDTFDWIFRREKIEAAIIEGDAFHRHDRVAMRQAMKEAGEAGNHNFSHFGPDSNLFGELEELFRSYSLSGKGRSRKYIHDDKEAEKYGGDPGTFTPWVDIGEGSDLLFYEGLHGAVKAGEHDLSKYPDLLIGVVPIINLEWIQKLHRDRSMRGYSTEAVVDTIIEAGKKLNISEVNADGSERLSGQSLRVTGAQGLTRLGGGPLGGPVAGALGFGQSQVLRPRSPAREGLGMGSCRRQEC